MEEDETRKLREYAGALEEVAIEYWIEAEKPHKFRLKVKHKENLWNA